MSQKHVLNDDIPIKEIFKSTKCVCVLRVTWKIEKNIFIVCCWNKVIELQLTVQLYFIYQYIVIYASTFQYIKKN